MYTSGARPLVGGVSWEMYLVLEPRLSVLIFYRAVRQILESLGFKAKTYQLVNT